MPCVDNVCGTGEWSGPKPGDPDNNSVLTATPAFGGVDVAWTYPVTNPFAVAHTEVFRSTDSNYTTAVKHRIVDGNFFFDAGETQTTFFYWIRFVSINGTYGDPIGPASAMPRLNIERTIEQLTGKIDAGSLALALKEDIRQIPLLGKSITQEVLDRMQSNIALGETLNGLQSELSNALTIVETRLVQLTSADAAVVQSMSLMAAGFNQSVAGLVEVVDLKTNATSALGSKVTTLESSVNGNNATGQIGLTTQVDTVAGKVTNIGAMYTVKLNTNGLIGGFGTYNDGVTVQAGFDVDSFWVGRTNANKRKPFIVENNEVFIDKAAINRLTFNTIRNEAGSIMGTPDGKLKAAFIDTEGISIQDSFGNTVLTSGNGKFSGELSAAKGTFSGTLTAEAINAVKSINIGANAATILVSESSPGNECTVLLNLAYAANVQIICVGALPNTSAIYLAYRVSGSTWSPLAGETLLGGTSGVLAHKIDLAAGVWDFRFTIATGGVRTSIMAFASIR